MLVRHATMEQLYAALDAIQPQYGGNLCFYSAGPYWARKGGLRFRITVRDSRGPGARRSSSFFRTKSGERRRLSCACWHVHGEFFDALLRLAPEAVVTTSLGPGRLNYGRPGKRITATGGNWRDAWVGALIEPVPFSALCECGRGRS